VDATGFIKAIHTVAGYPADGFQSMDEETFYAVVPGTAVDFEIDFYNDIRPASHTAVIFKARILVVGNGVATLDTRNVYIVVPPEGEMILI
jgi:hypothetical protein